MRSNFLCSLSFYPSTPPSLLSCQRWSTSPTTPVSSARDPIQVLLNTTLAQQLVWTDPETHQAVIYGLGDIAWVLASTALVWIMIPGVGFFYSGLLRRKNALSMIFVSMMAVAVVSFQASILPLDTPSTVLTSSFPSGSSGDILLPSLKMLVAILELSVSFPSFLS